MITIIENQWEKPKGRRAFARLYHPIYRGRFLKKRSRERLSRGEVAGIACAFARARISRENVSLRNARAVG